MKAKQTTLGILIIIAGLIVLLANTKTANMHIIVADWWPLALIVAGLYMLWTNPRSYVWPLVIIAIGSFTLLKTLGITDVSLGTLIAPIILVGIGASIIASARDSQRRNETSSDDNVTAILGGSTSRNTSDNYTGGTVTTIMGGAELDLSRAVIKRNAVLSVNIIMGGVELRVAEDVKIINRTQSVLGGIEDKTIPTESKSMPSLTIEGLVLMGGVEVKR